MGRLYRNIILFVLPLVIIIALVPLNKRFQYEGLKNDCFYHGLWFYDRLFDNKKPVDLAFLGSSQSIAGINDKIVEKEMSTTGLAIANFGYCRLGMNLNYIVLKEILKTKHPKLIIIEVREDENRYSHPVFPFLGESEDVLFANPFFNRDLMSDIYKHLTFKTEIIQEMAFKKREVFYPSAEQFGFCPNDDTASEETLMNKMMENEKVRPELKPYIRNFHMKFSRVYLEKINALCKKKGIEIYFLYLPTFGLPRNLKRPKEYSTYIKYGPVIIPPDSIFTKKSHWFDAEHLNVVGSSALSIWIGGEISRRLKK